MKQIGELANPEDVRELKRRLKDKIVPKEDIVADDVAELKRKGKTYCHKCGNSRFLKAAKLEPWRKKEIARLEQMFNTKYTYAIACPACNQKARVMK